VSLTVDASDLAIARGAGGYLLATWTSKLCQGVSGRRLDEGGGVVDSAPLRLARSANVQRTPAVDSTDEGFYAVWIDRRTDDGNVGVYGARVSPTGARLDNAALRISDVSTPLYASTMARTAIAFNGSTHLVVWVTAAGDLFGARVSRAGALLDATAIPILRRRTANDVVVTSDGADFFVVWTDRRAGNDVYGARVRGDGTVVDADGFVVSSFAKNHYGPAVDFDGNGYLVAWVDDRSTSSSKTALDLYGARVARDGRVLDTTGFAMAAGDDALRRNPSIAHDGKRFLVTFEEEIWPKDASPATYSIVAVPVDAGMRGDAPARIDARSVVFRDATQRTAPRLAWNGVAYLLTWSESHDGGRDILGARLTTSGSPLDPTGFPIAASETLERDAVAACTTGARCLVTYERYDATPAVQSSRIAGRIIEGASAPPASAAPVPAAQPAPADLTPSSEPSAAADDAGCGCHVGSPATASSWSCGGLFALAAVLIARRRRAPRARLL
jgi:MYXO-CTERM domain-containing protein